MSFHLNLSEYIIWLFAIIFWFAIDIPIIARSTELRNPRSLIHNVDNYKKVHSGSHRRPSSIPQADLDDEQNKVKPFPMPKEDPNDPIDRIRREFRKKYRLQKPKEYEKIVAEELVNDSVDEKWNYGEVFNSSPIASRPDGRGALNWDNYRWPYEMWIKIDENFGKNQQERIRSGIYTLSLALGDCFDLIHIPDNQEIPAEQDYVYIQKGIDEGCNSPLGRQGKKQILMLSPEHCGKQFYGTTIHELLHALCFFHEHTRPDRDNYVRVDETALIDAGIHPDNYKIVDVQSLFVEEYDFESILHYPLNKYMRARDKSLIPPGVKIGQQKKLSQLDYERIAKFYPCDEKSRSMRR